MQKFLLSALILCSVGVVGCGGGSSTTAVLNPYRGAYDGTYQATSSTSGMQVGTMTITVGNQGNTTGTVKNTTASVSSSLTGTVSNAGQVNVTFTNALETDTASGTVSFGTNGDLLGTMTQYHNGVSIGTFTFDATVTK